MGGRARDHDRTQEWDRPHPPASEEGLSGSPPPSITDPRYLLVDAPIEEAPGRLAFAFFAWRFSFSDLLAAVFELFEPPLSLLAMVAPSEGVIQVLNVAPWNPTKEGDQSNLRAAYRPELRRGVSTDRSELAADRLEAACPGGSGSYPVSQVRASGQDERVWLRGLRTSGM